MLNFSYALFSLPPFQIPINPTAKTMDDDYSLGAKQFDIGSHLHETILVFLFFFLFLERLI